MSVISGTWTLFRSPGLWEKYDVDCILAKGNQLLKFISKFRYLGIKDLPRKFFTYNSSVKVEFPEN